jgi:hypothetical protein
VFSFAVMFNFAFFQTLALLCWSPHHNIIGIAEIYIALYFMYIWNHKTQPVKCLSNTEKQQWGHFYVYLIPTSRNMTRESQLHRSTTDQPTSCINPTSHTRKRAAQLERSVTEHSSTFNSNSHQTQWPYCLSVTQEHYWAFIYIQVSPTNQNRPSEVI